MTQSNKGKWIETYSPIVLLIPTNNDWRVSDVRYTVDFPDIGVNIVVGKNDDMVIEDRAGGNKKHLMKVYVSCVPSDTMHIVRSMTERGCKCVPIGRECGAVFVACRESSIAVPYNVVRMFCPLIFSLIDKKITAFESACIEYSLCNVGMPLFMYYDAYICEEAHRHEDEANTISLSNKAAGV